MKNHISNDILPNVNTVKKANLCLGCGLCQNACPTNAIQIVVKNGEFRPVINNTKCNNDKGCHRCYDTCPGLGVELTKLSIETFGTDGLKNEKTAGRFLNCYSGYSKDNDIRWHSASGGMVSQFLTWLLEKRLIDGAVVTKFDNSRPLMTKTFIATTREDILDARSSKYGPVNMSDMATEIKKAQGTRYVVVGLPCHIQGFRKLMAIDRRLREKIVGLFAIYCSSGRSFNLTEYVMKERGIRFDELRYFAYRDEGCLGSMVAITEKEIPNYDDTSTRISSRNTEQYLATGVKRKFIERFQGYYHPLRSFFIPRRCLFCIDHYGELADLCFGDIHIKPYSDDKVGVNSIIARSQYWKKKLEECRDKEAIQLDEIPFEIVSSSQKMSFKKKGRNGAFLNLGKKIGWIMPEYDVAYLRQPTFRDTIDYIQNRCQQFVGSHKSLWWLISILKRDTSKLN